jgi:hypothetical protein
LKTQETTDFQAHPQRIARASTSSGLEQLRLSAVLTDEDRIAEAKFSEVLTEKAESQPVSVSNADLRNNSLVPYLAADLAALGEFGGCVTSLADLVCDSSARGTFLNIKSSHTRPDGSRPENYIFSTSEVDEAAQLYRKFLSTGVYNKPFDIESGFNPNLRWSSLKPFRDQILERFHCGDLLTILPFVAEHRTAHLTVRYALDLVPDDSIIAVSAIHDQVSESNVERTLEGSRSELVRQEQILSCFDWALIGDKCSIPVNPTFTKELFIPTGGKGLTMLAGLAWAELDMRLQGKMVIFSDTDFLNPWEYDSIAHLGIPLTINDDFFPRLIKTAKTGWGRNNEAWTREANFIATDDRLPLLTRQLALMCQQMIWPLSGNLIMSGDDLRELPFASGAGIETQINVYYAGRQAQYGQCEVAQVCNPNPLREDGESRPVRESALIGRCQLWLRSLLEMCGEYDLPLHRWTIEKISNFNQLYGGREHWGSFQSPFHTKQTPSKITQDYMLPSLNQCAQLGAIDWDRMKSLKTGYLE